MSFLEGIPFGFLSFKNIWISSPFFVAVLVLFFLKHSWFTMLLIPVKQQGNSVFYIYIHIYSFPLWFIVGFFNWRVIALQYCVSFRCTAVWSSYYRPFLNLPPRPTPPSGSSQSTALFLPASCSFTQVVYICWCYSASALALPASPTMSSSPFSTSASLFLSCK